MEQKHSYTAPIIGLVIAILALAGVIVFALSQQKTGADANTGSTSTNTSTDTTPSAETTTAATFTYTDNGFEPATLTVKAGTVVTIKNTSSNSMQFSSADHPTHLNNSELNLGALAPGKTTTVTPSRVGTWGIHDHLNSDHTATITVTE